MATTLPLMVRLCAFLIPARYRGEILADLLDEWAASVRPQRGHAYAAVWLLAHILRSAWAARRYGRPSTANPRRHPGLLADELAADWRLARRALRRSPLFTAVALIITAASIGLSVAVFSLVSGVLLRPLPYPFPDRLVRLAQFDASGDAAIPPTGGGLAAVTVGLWKEQTTTLEALVPYVANRSQTVAVGGHYEQMAVAAVGSRFFDLLGAVPDAGRLLTAADASPQAPPAAVISRRVWTELLGRRADAVGAVITIEGVPHTIVGVAPAPIEFPVPGIDVWTAGRWIYPPPGARASFSFSYDVVARIGAHATLEDVRREGERVLRLIAMADPAFFDGAVEIPRLRVVPLHDDIVAAARPALRALFAGMALVLVAACASLANLLVARNTSRARDLAIRATLGSTRMRLLRPLLFEQVALVGAGALLGAALGWWTLRMLPSLAPAVIPRLHDLRFDWVAFSIATGLTLVTALFIGVRVGSGQRDSNLRELSGPQRVGARSGSRSAEAFRGALVAAQVALAVVLLVGASLIGRSLWHLLNTPVGYQPDGVLTFQLGESSETSRAPGQASRFYEDLLDRLRGLSGVTAAAFGSRLPLHPGFMSGTLSIIGQPTPASPASRPRANLVFVSHEYHRALGTRVLEGRLFEPADFAAGEPVAIVDETLAARTFRGQAVGRRVTAFGPREWTIVGVVEGLRLGPVADAAEPIIYFPYSRGGDRFTFGRVGSAVLVRTTSDPMALAPAVRELVRAADPTMPVFNVMPLAERLDRTLEQPRFYTIALTLFALLALITVVLGVYGVQAYAVEKRTAEFGIRRALGARESDVLRLVMRRALMLALAGLVVGVPLAASGAGLLQALLFGVRPLDPLTFAGVPMAVLLLVLAASWQPARRALRIDPASALRVE